MNFNIICRLNYLLDLWTLPWTCGLVDFSVDPEPVINDFNKTSCHDPVIEHFHHTLPACPAHFFP